MTGRLEALLDSRRLPWLIAAAVAMGAIVFMMAAAAGDFGLLLKDQAPGADYSCFWAGAKTALSDPARLYDFRHITDLQGWPLGPNNLRPYIYPPSALFAFIPFALAPYWVGFGLWLAATGALYLWAAMRAGAPWWTALFPVVLLVVDCGQVTFLIGGLLIGALTLPKRPLLAGVLIGVAACIKPQMVVLVPLALVAEGRWRTVLSAGATGLMICAAATLIWGVEAWFEWLAALGRFRDVIFDNPRLVATAATPYAWLSSRGVPGVVAFLLAPPALAAVWFAFRRARPLPERMIALFGATLIVAPYAMNYELALLTPAVATYAARWREVRWPLYGAAIALYLRIPYDFLALIGALFLPFLAQARLRQAFPAAAAFFKS